MSQLLATLRQRIGRASACALLLVGVSASGTSVVEAASLTAGVRAPSTSRFT
jgi:hypothetical protein